MGKSALLRAAREGRVQAMQLKLFIETSVLQKREKPRYKAAAREACEDNTQERNRKSGKPRSRVLNDKAGRQKGKVEGPSSPRLL